jgi:hypothetical protein
MASRSAKKGVTGPLAEFSWMIDVASVLETLPAAFVASQQRELARVTATSNENDPRAEQLRTSIERARAVQGVALQGKTRVQHVRETFADAGDVFHGFVYDDNLAPQAGIIVRLVPQNAAASKGLAGRTDDDGYFRIDLGSKRNAKGTSRAFVQEELPDRVARMAARLRENAAQPPQPGDDDRASAIVEIVSQGKVVYRDSSLLALDGGRTYREYTISAQKGWAAADQPKAAKKKKTLLGRAKR